VWSSSIRSPAPNRTIAAVGGAAERCEPNVAEARVRELDEALLKRIRAVVKPGDHIETLTSKRPNKIISIGPEGVEVETLRSHDRGSGPQLVPAWMIVVAWDHFRRTGQLSQNQLLNELNVTRSAFVCGLLAQFREVAVHSTRPTTLEYIRR
jgi:hypothetical protein